MSIPKPTDWERWCEEQIASLRYLQQAGPELIRLAKMPTTGSDGYPASTGGERVQSESELTPTERAADRRGFPNDEGEYFQETDKVLGQLAGVFRHMREARAATTRAHALALLVEHRGDKRFGRQESGVGGGHCLACGRYVAGLGEDKLKGGYCAVNPGCYWAWVRFRRAEEAAGREPSPVVFRQRRAVELQPGA